MTVAPIPLGLSLSNPGLEHAPLPMARVEGATHIVRYANPAFCRLVGKVRDELVGKPFGEILPEADGCQALLTRVYRTGKFASRTEPNHAEPRPALTSYTMWPVMADERTVGVMIQVTEPGPLYEKTLAVSEALLLGALEQHELAEAADSANVQLQKENAERKQREHDALMLTAEVSHRVKNSLQIVMSLFAYEVRRAEASCVPGYEAMQARLGAIAELYDLISRSGRVQTVAVDAYLRDIATSLSASMLGKNSGIEIEVEAAALAIDPDRAVPFGLLVNELATNAIKHAFPDGKGRVVLRVDQIGDQVELTVADNGVGMKDKDSAKTAETHGADFVAIFVRQLGGTIAVSGTQGTGTTVRIRFTLLVMPPVGDRVEPQTEKRASVA